MSDPYVLYLSEQLSPEDFYAALERLGGTPTKETSLAQATGRLSAGTRHVWMSLRRNPEQELEEEDIENIRKKLGRRPATAIHLEVTREEGSMDLALAIALEFSKFGCCIVDDCDSKFMDIHEFEFDIIQSMRKDM